MILEITTLPPFSFGVCPEGIEKPGQGDARVGHAVGVRIREGYADSLGGRSA